MRFAEGPTIEFKQVFVADKINKAVIAFANTRGGILYIGIADDGSVVGVSDADSVCLKATNTIRDSIKPDVTMFVDCTAETIEGKAVIKISVQKGSAPPYYLAAIGLTPRGVFVRHGASSVSTSEAAFLKIIKESGPRENYEELCSLNQNLTFNEASPIFAAKGFLLDDVMQRKLKLKNEERLFTNLGLLISDQCPQTVKVSAFRDSSGANVSSWKEFSGSLLKQNEEIYRFIDIHNDNAIIGIAENLQRIERWSFPPVAVREALLNLLIHRDLSIRHSSQIKIYKDRIEFMSFGALPEGVFLEDVKRGAVAHRNRNLVEVFRRFGLIEAFGFGIPKIIDIYKAEQLEPPLEQTDSLFIITLPNLHEARAISNPPEPVTVEKAAVAELTPDEVVILDLYKAEDRDYIIRLDVEKALGISSTPAKQHLKRLVAKGALRIVGRSSSTKYYLNNQTKKSN